MIELIGYIGSFFFSVCAIPQVIEVWKTNSTKSLSFMFLLMWILGEVFMWMYIAIQNYQTHTVQWPLHLNYFFNGGCVAYLMYKKVRNMKTENIINLKQH